MRLIVNTLSYDLYFSPKNAVYPKINFCYLKINIAEKVIDFSSAFCYNHIKTDRSFNSHQGAKMDPKTIGQKFDPGKIAQIKCIKGDNIKDLDIKSKCFLLLMIYERGKENR